MPFKVILDTNVFISAVLFDGVSSKLVPLWQTGKISCLVSKEILSEYLTTLAYPKFELTDVEIKSLIEEELLPFVETIKTGPSKNIPILKDLDDQKFLICAKAGEADFLLTGDKELLGLQKLGKTKIISPGEFLKN